LYKNLHESDHQFWAQFIDFFPRTCCKTIIHVPDVF
jgi:hypothetical protein